MQAVGQEQEPPVASYEADVAKRKGTTNAILLLVVPVLVFIFVRPFFTHTDPDYWWHVRTGQYITRPAPFLGWTSTPTLLPVARGWPTSG